ncbi:MAG: hypothetical protein QM831_26190 [Kofleriaceae bacterium]
MKRWILLVVLAVGCGGQRLALSPSAETPRLHPDEVNDTLASVLSYLRHVGAP